MTGQLDLVFEPPRSLIERLRSAGVPATTAIVLHRNRRVMLSFDGRGSLRVHQGYAEAPDEIIAAIARWARPWTRRRDRQEAARVFLQFQVHGDAVPPRRRRPAPAEPGDEERLARLQALHRELNDRWFGGALAPIGIELSGRMKRKLGHYEPRSAGTPTIAIGRRHLRRDGWDQVAVTLLHEMVHQWQDEAGLPVDHGPAFRRKALEVGIEPRATMRRPPAGLFGRLR
ncbi:MAG: SprT-like domain-containing protein [Gemmatimonadales bacterium]|nr:SprT-like domain-containing protein [Gemmatimonadales bacterium]